MNTTRNAPCFSMHHRAFPELSARVRKAIHLWDEAAFHIVAKSYEEKAKSESSVDVTTASFISHDEEMQSELTRHGLHESTYYTSADHF